MPSTSIRPMQYDLNSIQTHHHRNMGASMTQLVRGCTMVLLSSMVPTIINTLGLHFLFFFHGVVCAIAALFVWRFVPETRGKTLLELCSIYSSSPESSFSSRGSGDQSSTISSNMSSVSNMSDRLSMSSDTSKSFQKSVLVKKFSVIGTNFDSSKSI